MAEIPEQVVDLFSDLHLHADLEQTPIHPLEQASALHELGHAYLRRYQDTHDFEDLEQSIQLQEEALTLLPAEHADQSLYRRLLGYAFYRHYLVTHSLTDLQRCIEFQEEALNTVPSDHPDQISLLRSLVDNYGEKYQSTRAISDLEKSIELCQQMIDAMPVDHPDRSYRLSILGIDYRQRFLKLDHMPDLERSIRARTEALKLTESGHPDRPSRLRSLAGAYEDRYQVLGELNDLDFSIKLQQEALEATDSDEEDLVDYVHRLGMAHAKRFKIQDDPEDLELSLHHYHKAMNMLEDNHPNRYLVLHDLAVSYGDRGQRTGERIDLDRCIQYNNEAIDAAPENPSVKSDIVRNLAIGYGNRFKKFGAYMDLERSIRLLEEALALTPKDHRDLATRIRSLGHAYNNRYQRTQNISDLEASIKLAKEVLDITPESHPDRSDRLRDLGLRCRQLYQVSNHSRDLEEALNLQTQALDILNSRDHNVTERANYIQSLAHLHLDKHCNSGDAEGLDKFMEHCQEALKITPLDYVNRADMLRMLGIGHELRLCINDDASAAAESLEAAHQCYSESLACSASPPNVRLQSGKALLTLLADTEQWQEAYEVAVMTIDLVPLLTTRFLNNSDRQHLLVALTGLASNATAIALNAGQSPYDALQLLEMGRGVIASSLNELRGDVSELEKKNPRLAKDFVSLRDQLQGPATPEQDSDDQRYRAAQRLDDLILEIRSSPGLDRFLLAPSKEELQSLADHGPIVVINVSEHRCDALIVETSQIRALELKNLSSEDIQDYLNDDLASALVLRWLWESIAQPVLDTLGFSGPPRTNDWPRVWWIPTGLLARFPLHAAGIYHDGSTETVLDRVVSSYSPSLKVMAHCRHHRAATSPAPNAGKVVLVGMSHTPGLGKLPYAAEEVRKLEKMFNTMQMQVRKPSADHNGVLSALQDCTIFHFAGHGKTDALDPSKSCLLLDDWNTTPLTVAALMEASVYDQQPYLAYLSACGTGRSKSETLLDESIHLMNAFQLAGFQHVIGSLWEVNDETCADIAAMTYKFIRGVGMGSDSVSKGLHNACRSLRKQWIRGPSARKWREQDRKLGETAKEAGHTSSTRSARSEGRDVALCDGDDEDDEPVNKASLSWVPYVHFGV